MPRSGLPESSLYTSLVCPPLWHLIVLYGMELQQMGKRAVSKASAIAPLAPISKNLL